MGKLKFMRAFIIRFFLLSLIWGIISCQEQHFIQIPVQPEVLQKNTEKNFKSTKSTHKEGHKKPLLGIQFQRIGPLNRYASLEGQYGVKVVRVVYESAAHKVDIMPGDIIFGFDGRNFSGVPLKKIESHLRNYIKNKKSVGDTLKIRLVRTEKYISGVQGGKTIPMELYEPGKLSKWVNSLKIGDLVDVKIRKRIKFMQKEAVLQKHKYFLSQAPQENEEMFPEYEENESSYAKMMLQLIQNFNLEEPYQDLLSRYEEDEWWDDGLRLKRIRYIHRDPLKMLKVTEDMMGALEKNFSSKSSDVSQLVTELADFMDAIDPETPFVFFEPPLTDVFEDHIVYLKKILQQAHDYRYLAFSALSEKDQKFMYSKAVKFSDKSLSLVWNAKSSAVEFQAFERVLQLATQVRYEDLLKGAKALSALTHKPWLKQFKKAIVKELGESPPLTGYKGIRGKIHKVIKTDLGPIIIGSHENNQYEDDFAFLIDMGGDDLYRNNAGAAPNQKMPLSFVIDFSGNDTYASTDKISQGSGYMGLGLLIDEEGDDEYWATRLSQGVGYLGIGILWDQEGNDQYHGQEFHQGFGIWGLGVLLDQNGDDQYDATLYSQGVGSAKGIGLLLDAEGDDQYVATGKFKSSYGSRGIYTGHSQGFGIGIRQYSSGGIGVLLDRQGRDQFRAGNFSQGGGYYFGWGILKNGGNENDLYIGSRYAQGFMAHSALGTLIDDGGDDVYKTNVGAAQSAAWDLGVAALYDKAGNDTYDARRLSFSQGAAAHNGFSMFIDVKGTDTYLLGSNQQARVPKNTYHDGSSFGFFFDLGGDKDTYDRSAERNNRVRLNDDYGVFVDLKKGVTPTGLDDWIKSMPRP